MRKGIYKILSVFVFAILYAFTTLMVILLLPFAYLKTKFIVKSLLHFWARSIFFLMGKKIVVKGEMHYSRQKRYIIIANHSSLFDIMAIMSLYPNVAWFGHYRLMKVPVFNQILRMINYIPLQHKSISNTKYMINEIIKKSKDNTIAIFPEGTRTLNGEMKDFFRGFIIAFRASNSDILPITLNGFYQLKPKARWYIDLSARLEIVIHPPLKHNELANKTDQEIIAQMKGIIESRLLVQPTNKIQPIIT
jgi:1-acyl-sn-glycerol-3-phosphate acyltransferase